jgi:two-component system, OmpR family, sensor histidine kinase KdpD
MKHDRRPAEDFLELVERSKRGRLKVYLGYAAGVGKTYHMLEEAHALHKRGVDVVLGFIETHGRAEVETLLHGLEYVPRQRLEYRGVSIEEMDVDAVLKRNPTVAVVDEIAHSNAPGLRHRKRFMDVLTLTEAGINVIAAFNVQHLESLHDLLERVTGVTVRETVPDTFLHHADQVVMMDLAIEDLVDRLRQGKIYPADKISWVLEHFFSNNNLTTLRELALREVAQNVERTSATQGPVEPIPSPDLGRVMVCLSSYSPRAQALLRRGSRLAGRLNTEWYVVYVETPSEAPDRIDATAQRHLHSTIDLARELGAEVVRIRGHDPVEALLDFAQSHRVGYIIVGRSHQPWWRRILGRDVVRRLLDQGAGFDLHIVSFEEREKNR